MRILVLGLTVIFHPTDTFYAVKKYKNQPLVLPAAVLMLMLLISRTLYVWLLHYPVSSIDLRTYSILPNLLLHVGLLLSISLATWNVSEIMNGETFLRETMMNTALATVPMTIIYPAVALLSRILGRSEEVFLTLGIIIMWVWASFLLFRGIMVLNNYTFGKTVMICFVSAVYIAILWVIGFVLVVFAKNMWQFIEGVFIELISSRA